MTQPNRLAISFSGGRTSAVMTKMLWDNRHWWDEVSITFANTGCEHSASLDFVQKCADHWGWPVVWIEAQFTHGQRIGVRHKIVDYDTASRNGEPFLEYIRKHGLPGPTNPNCTSRLKEDVMYAYRRDVLGWKKGTYDTAIGIRSDEIDRMNASAESNRFIYPMVTSGHTKQTVNAEMRSWPFDLELPGDHYGNCVWCWKKSLRKLVTLAKESPESFAFPLSVEHRYRWWRQHKYFRERRMFRNYMTAADVIKMANDPIALEDMNFHHYYDDGQLSLFDQIGWSEYWDTGAGCGESCEIGSD